jgi:Putative zinc-finger
MTQLLQSGQHPDADQLSAFAEHALPPHEQQQTLAHLAECADCRAIVFLAQQPDLAATTQPRPVAARRPWFSGWNLALPAALALAALVLITIHLRKPTTDQRQTATDNTAHMEQLAAPAQVPPVVPAKPIPAPIVKPQTAPNPEVVMGAIPPKPMPAQPMLQYHGSGEGRASFAAVQPGVTTGTNAGLGGQPRPSVSGGSISMNSVAPVIAPQQAALGSVDEAHREFRSSASQYSSISGTANGNLNKAVQAAPVPPPPAAPAMPASANETVTVSNASPTLATGSAASSQLIENETYASLPLAGLTARKKPSLPSHLAAVSTIANARQVLAIDTAGALFRSNDAGVTWQPIPAQWSGRAVKLQLTAQPDVRRLAKTEDSAAAVSAAKAASPAPTQPTFELTTDAGETWVSTDGQTWKHK